ncbi:MAG: hypothetical protein COY22_01060 [Candidatus Tagabacteria bacterium CG_4_10_14_0_2_um_filter_40_13]|uniref:Uncharacterized protein n=1 Tax=Candidatus Tagabacteria bacterium CG_4_9_14_0_2_um_filter_41_11 TaxID=1975019 RepID=A0A2M8EQU5_9BACT|nr:MAG: hypothetical protein COY22_01060 [Candidatus Tagabacteria bacterium CG_4_10_14_0_2_um_filter_40_13]PJC25102.1 MAG: hypothetical protein CO056_01905 [Candidatus Tagabacteria bacterium CG_4_9_14_0_2_um_filter_41_11]
MSNKKIKKAKGVTIDTLAGMVKKGFDHMDERFNQVDKRLDQHEKRFEDLEQGQEEIKLKLGDVAYRFELVELERRVNILERKANKR